MAGDTHDLEYYVEPPKDSESKKIEENTAWFKYPIWQWTKNLNGWPFSAEFLSAMFDYNVSPFFQSFMEIKVEISRNKVVLVPYSNHGRITWSEMTITQGSRPAGASLEDYADWSCPLTMSVQ